MVFEKKLSRNFEKVDRVIIRPMFGAVSVDKMNNKDLMNMLGLE